MKVHKNLPPELLLLAQICTKSFVDWGFVPGPTGGGSSQRSSRPSSWCRGWAPGEGGREGEGKGEGQERRGREGEERMRGEAGHPRFSYGLTPLAPWLLVVDKGM